MESFGRMIESKLCKLSERQGREGKTSPPTHAHTKKKKKKKKKDQVGTRSKQLQEKYRTKGEKNRIYVSLMN